MVAGGSPLGRYQELATTLISAFLVVSAVLFHAFGPTAANLTFLDAAALLALGAVYGKVSAANGYAKSTEAAHKRLDSIGAPPADSLAGEKG
jgi:hypothetical protein